MIRLIKWCYHDWKRRPWNDPQKIMLYVSLLMLIAAIIALLLIPG